MRIIVESPCHFDFLAVIQIKIVRFVLFDCDLSLDVQRFSVVIDSSAVIARGISHNRDSPLQDKGCFIGNASSAISGRFIVLDCCPGYFSCAEGAADINSAASAGLAVFDGAASHGNRSVIQNAAALVGYAVCYDHIFQVHCPPVVDRTTDIAHCIFDRSVLDGHGAFFVPKDLMNTSVYGMTIQINLNSFSCIMRIVR